MKKYRFSVLIWVLVLFLGLVIFNAALAADVKQEWAVRYGNSYYYHPNDTAVDEQGNLYVTGTSTSSFYTEKYSPAGSRLWAAYYSEGGSNGANSIRVHENGNVYVMGYTGCVYGGRTCAISLVKYNSAGARIWARKYQAADKDMIPYNIVVDRMENIYVSAGKNSYTYAYASDELVMLKYDKDGNLLWEDFYTYGRSHGTGYPGIKMDENENLYTLIKSSSWNSSESRSYLHLEVLKYDGNGNRIWVARTPEHPDSVVNEFDFGLDDNGNIYTARSSALVIPYMTEIDKFDPDGNLLWTKPGLYGFGDMYVDASGKLDILSIIYGNQYVSRYDAEGNLIWIDGYGIEPGKITGDIKGDIYAAGRRSSDIYILKYDQAGNSKWVQSFTMGGYRATPRTLQVEKNGDVFVTGYSDSYGGMIVKYSQSGFNRPPVANAGPDQTVSCTGNGADVRLDGSQSTDPDGDTLTYEWTGPFGMATGPTPTVHLSLGIHTVSLAVSDGKGGTSQDTVKVTVADTVPPSTSITLSGVEGGNGWFRSDVAVKLLATDNCSGCMEVRYRLDGSESVTPGAEAFMTFTRDDKYDLAYWSRDNSGNTEQEKTAEIKIDKTPPAITAVQNPNINLNGWNNTDVTVTFTCNDALSGVASCPSPVTVTTEGAGQVVCGTAIDNAGNTTSTCATLNIDKTGPVITVSGVQDGATYELGFVPSASYSATDALSGAANSSATLSGGDGLGLGTFIYTVKASDNAGNTTFIPVTYQVIATPNGLLALLDSLVASGQLDPNIAGSLAAKIKGVLDAKTGTAADGKLQAFINQVNAQTGKKITPEAADVLINAATYIMDHN